MNPKNKSPETSHSSVREYFQGDTLKSYTHSKSMMHIQEKMTLRILQLSGAEPPALILDLGMGAGFSSVPLYMRGFTIIGMELLWKMLIEYPISELNPIAGNMMHLVFRENLFDYIFSVSAFQWTYRHKGSFELIRFDEFAKSLNMILKIKGVLVFQLYESSESILDMIYSVFIRHGFSGKYILDNPQSKKKRKTYLYLRKVKSI
ncbi:MAG: methyltransferase domain-containing protein [Candidatus Lokiarchaeota archaeon]|nr:methyltransferase domain-containing protein [Candidatus Lokiarchaeota archaeon]